MQYNIYAGMGGGFSGPTFIGTYECENEEAALEIAYEAAVEEYQSYEGCHGILNWDECRADLEESGYEDITEDDVNDHYNEQIESWISYHVRPFSDSEDPEDFC